MGAYEKAVQPPEDLAAEHIQPPAESDPALQSVQGVLPRAHTETVHVDPDLLGEAPPKYRQPQDSWPQLREAELTKGREAAEKSNTI